MPAGHFLISPTADRRDILSQVDPSAKGEPSDDETSLLNEVERVGRVLRLVFDNRPVDFERYYGPLLSLAQGGLVGPHAQPGIARRALEELKREVLDREAGRVKNAYMSTLGKACGIVGAPALLLGLAARIGSTFPSLVSDHGIISADATANALFLIAGCAAGVWMSFGARKALLTFEDLGVPEQDYLRPGMRVSFAELVTVSLALLFQIGAMEVKLGSLSTADVFRKPLAAGVIGLLCGFSEQVIPKTLANQASRLFK